jgi:glycosyltransferase involved in cell wall biosynthesis
MKLLIAIPALNEEASIAETIERCLEARSAIIRESPVTEVEITVVSDGSTDRTVALASPYQPRIKLLVFEKNRGYGAAIKEAWRESDADLVSFMDADGTCDPAFLAPLCRILVDKQACVVLGSRMHHGSRMPLVRRAGNVIFAALLTVFSSARVNDSASGMRVVRRSCLDRLMPLPDGLDFTPAMSARCILAGNLPIRELDMPYAERAGRSKLRVIQDGLRFLTIILKTALLYRPSRVLGLLALFLFVVAGALMIWPTIYYLHHRSVPEWTIYRFVVSLLLGIGGVACLCMGYLARRIVRITLAGGTQSISIFDRFSHCVEGRYFWLFPATLMVIGGWLVYPSFRELVATGGTHAHWSRFVVMSFFVGTAILLVITRALVYILNLLGERVAYVNKLLDEKLAAPVAGRAEP